MELLIILVLILYTAAILALGAWLRGRNDRRAMKEMDDLFGGEGAFEAFVKTTAENALNQPKGDVSDEVVDRLLGVLDCETDEDESEAAKALLSTQEQLELFEHLLSNALGAIQIDWDSKNDRWAVSCGFRVGTASNWGTYTGATPMEAMLKAKEAMPKTTGLGWPA